MGMPLSQRPLFEQWLERHHGVLTFRLTQVLTGHGCFGRFLFGIWWDETLGRLHCVVRPKFMVEHTVKLCPAWVVLLEVIGGGELSCLAMAISRPWCGEARGRRKPPPSSAK